MNALRQLLLLISAIAVASAEAPVEKLIPWLLDEHESLKDISFASVISITSGKKVIPVDAKDGETRRILGAIGRELDAVLAEMNKADSPAKQEKRVNEMSAHFENAIRTRLNAIDGFECAPPKTAGGTQQRSGYPDLRLVDKATGRVFYLDPKLYASDSRASSLRTFYFTPKRETNKVNDDAHHLIIGVAHRKSASGITFATWELIDLSAFRVSLKAEFEGSNRDLYREEAVVGRSK